MSQSALVLLSLCQIAGAIDITSSTSSDLSSSQNLRSATIATTTTTSSASHPIMSSSSSSSSVSRNLESGASLSTIIIAALGGVLVITVSLLFIICYNIAGNCRRKTNAKTKELENSCSTEGTTSHNNEHHNRNSSKNKSKKNKKHNNKNKNNSNTNNNNTENKNANNSNANNNNANNYNADNYNATYTNNNTSTIKQRQAAPLPNSFVSFAGDQSTILGEPSIYDAETGDDGNRNVIQIEGLSVLDHIHNIENTHEELSPEERRRQQQRYYELQEANRKETEERNLVPSTLNMDHFYGDEEELAAAVAAGAQTAAASRMVEEVDSIESEKFMYHRKPHPNLTDFMSAAESRRTKKTAADFMSMDSTLNTFDDSHIRYYQQDDDEDGDHDHEEAIDNVSRIVLQESKRTKQLKKMYDISMDSTLYTLEGTSVLEDTSKVVVDVFFDSERCGV
jgi:hypothetical protein